MFDFDIDKFWLHGYAVTKIEDPILDKLLAQIESERYVDEPGSYELDNPASVSLAQSWEGIRHPQAPAWDKKSPFNSSPEIFDEFWQSLAFSDYFKWFTQLYGNFTHKTVMVHKYMKQEGMGWHYDVTDSTLTLNILYLTRDTFTHSDGGYLGIGHCNVTPEGTPIKESVREVDRILPNHGVMVTINNMNPKVLHRVEKLVAAKSRYSLVCQFGYIGNVLHKERMVRNALS